MRRRRRSVEQCQQIIEDWENSGLSVSQFCRENKVPTSAFYRWKTKFNKQKVHGQAAFIQVACPATQESKLELAFPAGYVLRFTEATNKKAIVSTLTALKEAGLC